MEVSGSTINAELLSETLIGLPFYPDMSIDELGCVTALVGEVCGVC